jgi:hypothetical protein
MSATTEWERAWLERARAVAGCDAETRDIDRATTVGIIDGEPRFWCFHRDGRVYRMSLRTGRAGNARYTNSAETFPTYAAAERVCAERNGKAVRR